MKTCGICLAVLILFPLICVDISLRRTLSCLVLYKTNFQAGSYSQSSIGQASYDSFWMHMEKHIILHFAVHVTNTIFLSPSLTPRLINNLFPEAESSPHYKGNCTPVKGHPKIIPGKQVWECTKYPTPRNSATSSSRLYEEENTWNYNGNGHHQFVFWPLMCTTTADGQRNHSGPRGFS